MTSANDAATRLKKPRGKPKLIRRRPRHPILRISPYAWAKLLFLRDAGPTEIGGFGISRTGDLLLIEDVRLVRQQADVASVAFEDAAVADYFDEQVEAGRKPEEFARVWVHTHPGNSAEPSGIDEETFARVFGNCQWAVMLIVAAGGATYARLRFGVGPSGELAIPVEIAYEVPFAGSDQAGWEAEYLGCVFPVEPTPFTESGSWLGRDSYRYDDYFRDLEGFHGPAY